MANIAQYYADLLDRWEKEAYEREYGCDWLEEVGEAVKFYAMECASKKRRQLSKGLLNISKRKDRGGLSNESQDMRPLQQNHHARPSA